MPVLVLTADNAVAVGPNGSGNINIVGAGGITTSGNSLTNTITITATPTVTPSMVFSSSSGNLSTTAGVRYISWSSGAANNPVIAYQVVPVATTARRLYVYVQANSSTTDVAIDLYVNGAATALTVTVPALTAGTFSDVINSVALAAGDLVCWSVAQSTVGTISVGAISMQLS